MTQSSRWQSVAEMARRVSSRRGRELSGLYSIEGTRLIERALRAGAPLEAVLTTARFLDSPRGDALFAALSRAAVPIILAPDEILTELTEGRDLGRIIGLVRRPPPIALADILPAGTEATSDELRPTRDEAILPRPRRSPAPLLFLAAVDIVDPGNVGALTRTAHAGGATGLLVAGASDPFHPRATRIGRGSIFKLPVVAYETPRDLLADLRRCGVVAVATAAAGGVALPAFARPRGPLAVLMGNEAAGLPPDVAAAVEYHLTIPMPDGVDSYSVNAAAAIILYALCQPPAKPAGSG